MTERKPYITNLTAWITIAIMMAISWTTLNSRVTATEVKIESQKDEKAEIVKRLERIENKMDNLIIQHK